MGGEVQKKYSRKGKLNEKNSCTPINPKKYSCYGLKKNLYKDFYNEKKFLRLENSPAPITFLMVRPLTHRAFPIIARVNLRSLYCFLHHQV